MSQQTGIVIANRGEIQLKRECQRRENTLAASGKPKICATFFHYPRFIPPNRPESVRNRRQVTDPAASEEENTQYGIRLKPRITLN
jgi:hypothetical protein